MLHMYMCTYIRITACVLFMHSQSVVICRFHNTPIIGLYFKNILTATYEYWVAEQYYQYSIIHIKFYIDSSIQDDTAR